MNQTAEKENNLLLPEGWTDQKEIFEKIESWFRDEDNPKKYCRTIIDWNVLKEKNLDSYNLARWAITKGLLETELVCGPHYQERIIRTQRFFEVRSGSVKLVSNNS